MKQVILTAGPRGAGKSTFCEKAVEENPSITIVSRDRILMELFGRTYIDRYSGGHYVARDKMWEDVEAVCKQQDFNLILDAWNGHSSERRVMSRKLRELGAEQLIIWYFVTPSENVEEWFWHKPEIAKVSERPASGGEGKIYFSENAPRADYNLFHKFAETIDKDGFDKVVRINPLIMTPTDVLSFEPV